MVEARTATEGSISTTYATTTVARRGLGEVTAGKLSPRGKRGSGGGFWQNDDDGMGVGRGSTSTSAAGTEAVADGGRGGGGPGGQQEIGGGGGGGGGAAAEEMDQDGADDGCGVRPP